MPTNSDLARWIGVTHAMDQCRGYLKDAEKMRYTRLRHAILHGGDGVTEEDIQWMGVRIREKATK